MNFFPTVPARPLLPPCSHAETIAVFDHTAFPYVFFGLIPSLEPLYEECTICHEHVESIVDRFIVGWDVRGEL